MLTFQNGEATVTIVFYPLLILLAIGVTFGLMVGIYVYVQRIQLTRNCKNGRYEQAIKNGNALMKRYQRNHIIKKNKDALNNLNVFRTYLAISYLGIGKFDEFFENISLVSDDTKEKYFWFSVCYFMKGDTSRTQSALQPLRENEKFNNSVEVMDALIRYRESESAESRKILEEYHQKLNFAILKKLIDDTIK